MTDRNERRTADATAVLLDPSPLGDDPARMRFVGAVIRGDLETAGAMLDSFGPDDLGDLPRSELGAALRNLDYDVAAQHPTLLALRAIATMYAFTGGDDEIGTHLYESIVRLARSEDERSLEWAAHMLSAWGEWMLHLGTPGEGARLGMRLLDRAPALGARHPGAIASVALLATEAGDRTLAPALWSRALDHEYAADSADEWWSVRTSWARSELMVGAPDPALAATNLRRARNHFRGRPGRANELFLLASAGLCWALLLSGQASTARDEAEVDLRHCEPGSEFAGLMYAMHALACALLRDTAGASGSLQAHARSSMTNDAREMCLLGPTRMLLSLLEGNREALLAEVARLGRLEKEHASVPEHRAFWRIVAAHSIDRIGHAQAGSDANASVDCAWLADEAIRLCDEHGLPLHAMLALAVRATVGTPTRRRRDEDLDAARRALAIAAKHDMATPLQGIFPTRGAQVLWMGVAADLGDRAFLRDALLFADEVLSRTTREQVVELLGATSAPRVARMAAELGAGDGMRRDRASRTPRRIEIRLLGTLQVIADDEVVPVDAWGGRRQARLLLARLLMQDGAVGRAAIARDLWPRVPEEQAAKRIAPLAHWTRSAIGANARGGGRTRSLTSTGSGYALRLGPDDRCDVLEFLESARACLNGADRHAARRQSMRALDLYRGHFLAGEGFDPWILSMRDQLRNLWSTVALHLAAIAELPDEQAIAMSTLERLLEDEPCREDLCRALMQIYATAGNIGAASQAFHHTRTALSEQLGLAPSPETVDMHALLIGRETPAPAIAGA